MDILPSARSGFYILEKCRVMMKDNRVCYVQEDKNKYKFISIPNQNTSFIVLTIGCSISTSAARELAESGVIIMFAGNGGTPVFMASQEEYRPSEYMQQWVRIFFDEKRRLSVAKYFQEVRIRNILKIYNNKDELKQKVFIDDVCAEFLNDIGKAQSGTELLSVEGLFTKKIYARLAKHFKANGFKRNHGAKDSSDLFNSYLDHGNYLAYGIASAALFSLGISFAFPVLHGKTRRGALVFDVADIIKDALIMPNAFISASLGESDRELRERCINELDKNKALPLLFEIVKECATEGRF